MRIVFIGSVSFSKKALEKVLQSGGNVVGVVTKESSSFNSDFCDLSSTCINHDIPWIYVTDINGEKSLTWIRSVKPDIIFCFGWSSLLKKELLEICNMGVLGYHPALLPQNRGRHPLIWALVLGLKKTGSTFFFMDEGADSGPILSQKEINIYESDDAGSLYKRMTQVALNQIEEFIPQLQSGLYPLMEQDDSKANVWRKRYVTDGKIDFRMDAVSIYNLVRGLTSPYSGAHIELVDGTQVKIWKAEASECNINNIEYGKVIEIKNNNILVKCLNGAVWLKNHTFAQTPRVGDYL